MTWGYIAVAGATLIGAKVSSDNANKASSAMQNAAKDANSTQLYMYDQSRQDQAPYRDAGAKALGQMQNPNFQQEFNWNDPGTDNVKDPGYAFRLAEGNKAINAAAASRGMGNSGATLKALTKYGQDYASNEYGNAFNRFNTNQTQRFNRLASLAGVGQTANGQTGVLGANAANQMGSNMLGAGNAQAAAAMAGGNAVNGAIGQGMNAWMNHNLMNQMKPGGGGGLGNDGIGGTPNGFAGNSPAAIEPDSFAAMPYTA